MPVSFIFNTSWLKKVLTATYAIQFTHSFKAIQYCHFWLSTTIPAFQSGCTEFAIWYHSANQCLTRCTNRQPTSIGNSKVYSLQVKLVFVMPIFRIRTKHRQPCPVRKERFKSSSGADKDCKKYEGTRSETTQCPHRHTVHGADDAQETRHKRRIGPWQECISAYALA